MTRLFMSIVFIVVASAIITGVCGQQQQCYVCVPNSNYDGDVIKMFPGETLPLCGATLVAKVCPATYSRGCLTEINGPEVMRTCALIAMNVCKTANQVEYCYCTGNLCNSGVVQSPGKHPPDDDEDENVEGSGNGGSAAVTTPPPQFKSTAASTTTRTTSSSSTSNSNKPANSATTNHHHRCSTLSIVSFSAVLTLLLLGQ